MDNKKQKPSCTRKNKTPKKLKRTPEKNINLTLAELKQKYKDLCREEILLDKEIDELESLGIDSDLQPLMKALHDYNEMKDLTQMVLGYLANAEHITVAELHLRYELPTD